MGLRGGRLVFLLLLGLFSLSCLASAAGFSDCFSREPLARFWADGQYEAANPDIITILSFHSYSFAFDGSAESLALENISLRNGSALLAGAPAQYRTGLSEPAALLSQASDELAKAKEAKRTAHTLSTKAQSAVRDNFGIENAPLANIFFLAPIVGMNSLLKVLDISNYVALYPVQYQSTLEHSAQAHDLSQQAASSISSLVQSEYVYLSRAGAGNPSYHGSASQPFNYAESLLAPESGFCAGDQLAAYFSSSPQMPNFSTPSFSESMDSLAGASQNSSISRALSLYIMLSEAREGMVGEYETAKSSASQSMRALSLEVSLLGGEKLQLIGDMPSQQQGSGLLVGSGYSGIYSGYLQAKDDLLRAESELGAAQSGFSSKGADGWLAGAISDAESSSEISLSTLSSLRQVRSNAELAVLAQEKAAQQSITQAQGAVSSQASTFASAQSLSAARDALQQAEAAFLLAKSLPTLGERFDAYSNAARLAGRATSLSQSQQDFTLAQEASTALSGYSSLVSSAESDGLDVSYEKERLASYRALLSTSQSQDVLSAVSDSIISDRLALVQRLYESYSYLEEKYATASQLASEMGAAVPALPQQLGQLAQYFPSGKLDALRAAGHLKQADSSLSSLLASAQAKIPAYLSSLLSENAHAAEICGEPVLGRQSDCTIIITTQNPSQLSSGAEVPFSIGTTVPIYSSDFSQGDAIADAYPEKGKTTIILSSVAQGQAFTFTFAKKDAPAQMLSSEDSCELASWEYAKVGRTISFMASRALPSLLISQPAPPLSYSATAQYGGQAFPLSTISIGGENLLQGSVYGIAQGRGAISISYSVRAPFSTSLSSRTYETLPLGEKKVSYTLFASAPQLDCASASASLFEPYSRVSNLSIMPLSGEKVLRAAASTSGNETQLSFTFSPLVQGKQSSFAVSYIISDPKAALSEALSQAELLVLTYNRTKDALALSEARLLAQQGRDSEALSVLSQMRQDAQSLSGSTGDYLLFLQEKPEADALLSQLASVQSGLARVNSSCSPQFSSALFKYQSSLASASDEADSGGYQKAISILRKAKGDLSSSLAALSLSSLTSASGEYAKARKANAGSELLPLAQAAISSAQSSYTAGEFSQSLLGSSEASALLLSISDTSASAGEQMLSFASALRSDYAALRAQTEPLLANYSSQYSALSTQSRRQLPLTPSQAQARLDEADKLLTASKKPSIAPSDALSQANSSYSKLSSLHSSLSDALSSLASSASTSLSVARAALSEVKSRAGAEDAQQIGAEVSRAGEFLSNAMYADSIASSDRAIAAANAALSKASGANPLQPALLALISIAFLGGAAYYFFMGKKRAPPSEKKEMPKAE